MQLKFHQIPTWKKPWKGALTDFCSDHVLGNTLAAVRRVLAMPFVNPSWVSSSLTHISSQLLDYWRAIRSSTWLVLRSGYVFLTSCRCLSLVVPQFWSSSPSAFAWFCFRFALFSGSGPVFVMDVGFVMSWNQDSFSSASSFVHPHCVSFDDSL